jgi:hypothetical protein
LHRPYVTTRKATTDTTAMVRTPKTRCSMAGIMGASALAFGFTSEKRLATFAVSAVGFVATEESNLARRCESVTDPLTHQRRP